MPEYFDVPPDIVSSLRKICEPLPETYEEPAWTGFRWRIRKRTFAHVLSVESPRGPVTVISFRSSVPELDALRAQGHPFFSPGWGTNVIGMVLDDGTDYDEVRELLTESYCILAPKKLAAMVTPPTD